MESCVLVMLTRLTLPVGAVIVTVIGSIQEVMLSALAGSALPAPVPSDCAAIETASVGSSTLSL